LGTSAAGPAGAESELGSEDMVKYVVDS
jgi:hypothetical protein